MKKYRSVLLALAAAVIIPLVVTGCKGEEAPKAEGATEAKAEETKDAHAGHDHAKAEHPKGEHPKGEHPKAK